MTAAATTLADLTISATHTYDALVIVFVGVQIWGTQTRHRRSGKTSVGCLTGAVLLQRIFLYRKSFNTWENFHAFVGALARYIYCLCMIILVSMELNYLNMCIVTQSLFKICQHSKIVKHGIDGTSAV